MEEQLSFSSRMEFREWLTGNHASSKGIWMIFGKTDKIGLIKNMFTWLSNAGSKGRR